MNQRVTDGRFHGPRADVKRRIGEIVEAHRAEILDLSHRIHADPEPAFAERHAASLVAEAVARHGFSVEHPAGRLETAVRGRLPGGRGVEGARIAILAEYDALPGLGHGCGHNTMAASGVGAAICLAELAPELAGEIVFLGTPAEERGSGKQWMIDDGLFEGIDAALLFHPSDRTQAACSLLASVDIEVLFTGLQAHAAADPWKGRNALDALIMLFTSVGLWRQQLRPDARVHGIVTEGGTAANIIPSRAAGRFMVRSTDQGEFERMEERFRGLVQAAAMAADCEGEAVFTGGSSTMKDNAALRATFSANMAAYGIADHDILPDSLGSSDMGNVSQTLPAIHPMIAICDEGVAGHSIEFRDAAVLPRADEVTLIAAALVAQTAFDLYAEPSLVDEAWREFRAG